MDLGLVDGLWIESKRPPRIGVPIPFACKPLDNCMRGVVDFGLVDGLWIGSAETSVSLLMNETTVVDKT